MRNYSYKSLYNVETLYPLSKPIGSQVPEISNFVSSYLSESYYFYFDLCCLNLKIFVKTWWFY